MRGGVDPARETGDDDVALAAQFLGQTARHAGAERRGVARAHQRDGGALEQRHIADRPEKRRWIGDVGQLGGVLGATEGNEGGAGEAGRFELLFHNWQRAELVILHAGGAGHLGQGLERGPGGAMVAHQAEKRRHANAA